MAIQNKISILQKKCSSPGKKRIQLPTHGEKKQQQLKFCVVSKILDKEPEKSGFFKTQSLSARED